MFNLVSPEAEVRLFLTCQSIVVDTYLTSSSAILNQFAKKLQIEIGKREIYEDGHIFSFQIYRIIRRRQKQIELNCHRNESSIQFFILASLKLCVLWWFFIMLLIVRNCPRIRCGMIHTLVERTTIYRLDIHTSQSAFALHIGLCAVCEAFNNHSYVTLVWVVNAVFIRENVNHGTAYNICNG